MSKGEKRHIFAELNKFHVKLLYPVLFFGMVAVLICLFNLLYLYYIDYQMAFAPGRVEFIHKIELELPWYLSFINFKTMVPITFATIIFVILSMLFWFYHIIHHVVGPYRRVKRELDEIIEGKRDLPIGIRDGDEMFSDLLKRINSLKK